MKKVISILLLTAMLLGVFSTAFAAGPSNANILTEYQQLMKGSWQLAGYINSSEYWKGLSTEFSFSQGKHMLFITSTDEVYFAWNLTGSHNTAYCAEVAFSADGKYLMLIKEDNAAVYVRK